MNLEKLLHQHNKLLEQHVEENVFLNQRIIARLKDSGESRHPLKISFRKYVLLYSFLFFIFTLINFIGIGLIKKMAYTPQPNALVKMDAFQANYPGSISYAYNEVLK